jgi:hypothetical protein
MNKEFEPRYNWSKRVDDKGNLVFAQELKRRPAAPGRSMYDCHSYGLKTPGRAEEIVKAEAFRADMQQQLFTIETGA